MTMIRTSLMVLLAAGAVSPRVVRAVPLTVLMEVGEPQVKDDLFAGTEKFAQGATDVTEVNMDKNMLGMVAKDKGKGEIANKIDFIVVHTYSYDKPGMYRQEDVDVYRQRLTDGSWSCSIHTKDRSGTTDICSRTGDHGETSEMVVMTSEPKELTFIHMKGRGLSMGDLSKIGGLARRGITAPPAPPAPLTPRVPPAPR